MAAEPNLETKLDRLSEAVIEKIDELRAERDSARAHWAGLQKTIDDADLSQLLSDVLEFVSDQADADGGPEGGFIPNTAMRLQKATERALRAFGWEV